MASMGVSMGTPDTVGWQGGPGSNEDLKIVKFRDRSVRIECGWCGFRFTIDLASMADAFERDGDERMAARLRRWLP